MKSSIILQRLKIDPKPFFTDFNFQFIHNLSIIYGRTGMGKNILLKIIKLLTDNNKNEAFDFFKHLFAIGVGVWYV